MTLNSMRIYESFETLPTTYNSLFEHSARKSFYLSRDWLELIFQICYSGSRTTRIYGLEQGATAEPTAALIMSRNGARKSPLADRRLRSMSNWYSGVFAPLLSPATVDPAKALNNIFSAVARDSPAWDSIEMAPLDPDDANFVSLTAALRENGMIPQIYNYSGDWYERVEGANFDDYWRSLSSKKRNTLRRKEKSAEAAGNVEFRMYVDETDLDRALRDYDLIYAHSWKQAELFKDFIPGLIRQSARRKTLRLGIIYVAGEPAAVELCIAVGGVAVMAKTAYIDKYASLSVGALATLKVLRRVLDDDKIHEIDFGNGDDPYKREWVRSRRERRGLVAFNIRTLHGLLGAGWNIGGRLAKEKLYKFLNHKGR